MTALKKYKLSGEQVGEVAVDDKLINVAVNLQLIKDYITALRANARQWSANTRGRSEVNHSGQKPHPQKGTGRARQGFLGAPQYKGGGRVFTPKPKFDQHVRINRKEKRMAINHLIAEKIQDSRVHVLQYQPLDAPKTKTIEQFLRGSNLKGKKVLFVCEAFKEDENQKEKYDNFRKSVRNIPKTEFALFPNLSGYDLVLCQDIVILEPALDTLMTSLKGKE